MERRAQVDIEVQGAEPGAYLAFESLPGFKLKLESLESRVGKKPVELVAVKNHEDGRQSAVVFVPEERSGHFEKRVDDYRTGPLTINGNPKHRPLIERIASISLATLEGLWTDARESFPADANALVWWEVWLRRLSDGGEFARFLEFAGANGIRVSDRRLQFEDRTVVLAEASPDQLASSLDVLGDVAEVRGVTIGAAPFDSMNGPEQADWARELLERTSISGDVNAPAVCVLDTGVNRGHPLLTDVVAEEDAHAFQPLWTAADHPNGHPDAGHGTAMAGLAAYGDLSPVLESTLPVVLRHRVESVKILPPAGGNECSLYGTITATAASIVETQAPFRPRCFSLAVTAPKETIDGRPTSWSAAIDALSTGRAFDQHEQGFDYTREANLAARRLFIVSAGNVDLPAKDDGDDHFARSTLSMIQDPAQAWNALSVGANTNLAKIDDPEWEGWSPLARPGDLSPHSRTSTSFDRKQWPLKPDVVFEGGNVARDGAANLESYVADLNLLSTHHQPSRRAFTLVNATSAATTQVARMAAILQAEYPALWPETIRALIVHSARWTTPMLDRLGPLKDASMAARESHVRQFGFGVPCLARAGRSATDALTLIAEQQIQPFTDRGTYKDMHIHELPWPKDELVKLDEATVRLRVTLSYFIEPNPGSRGWSKRYSYQSHGLRFRVKRAEETREQFEKGLSKAMLGEEEAKPDNVPLSGWFLGDNASKRGSLHSNIWEGSAADLAERNVIAVYGIAGWWKEQKRAGRVAPYALVVSVETDEITEDIWTPVASLVGVPAAVMPIEM